MSTENTESPALVIPSREKLVSSEPKPRPSALSILEAVTTSGLTKDNVEVAKELIKMARDERAEEAKAAFAKAFFQLRKNMPEIYADKEGKNDAGAVCFRYCSEEEIAKKLEPHLMTHGFAMLFGQSSEEGSITVNVTLMHELGHSETREFTVRAGATNRMKDGAMADAGGATTAWRHLMIKMFGLKSRITDIAGADARKVGERISKEKVQYLREQLHETGSPEAKFLEIAGAKSIEEIGEEVYPMLVRLLAGRAKAK